MGRSVGASALTLEAEIARLGRALEGRLILPGEGGYDEARRLYNAMIDRRPALIVRCSGPADVVRGVAFARENDLPISIKGGGHNVAGNAVCDGGLMLDMSGLRRVRVDPGARVARAEAGATWSDFDRATTTFGLASTGGAISSTGIAGLTLGGGLGMLMRKHGLACDNLIAAEVVLADGHAVRASEREEPELFWALRGGGGNFGVVTALEYRLHPLGDVLAGSLLWPLARARDVIGVFREFTARAPEEATAYIILLHGPDGAPYVGLQYCHAGRHEEGLRLLRPFEALGAPVLGEIRAVPYAEMQCALDATFPGGFYNYWKSSFWPQLDEAGIDVLLAHFEAAPSAMPLVMIEHLGGAVARVPKEATAFVHRDVPYNLALLTRWTDPRAADTHIRWTKNLWEAMRPFTAEGVYVNYLSEGERARVPEAYGSAHVRLAQVKRRYDPANVFRINQNIAPAR
jgi:hypothetical protein